MQHFYLPNPLRPCTRVFFFSKKLRVSRFLKKFCNFYGPQRFITLFAKTATGLCLEAAISDFVMCEKCKRIQLYLEPVCLFSELLKGK
jgi:hypothetical protein